MGAAIILILGSPRLFSERSRRSIIIIMEISIFIMIQFDRSFLIDMMILRDSYDNSLIIIMIDLRNYYHESRNIYYDRSS